jgi:hypothetical protein
MVRATTLDDGTRMSAAAATTMQQPLTPLCLLLCCQSRRSSSRTRQQTVHYAEEQAAMRLQAQELLDLRRAAAASLESDVEEESPDEPSPPALSSSSDEEEEKEHAAETWSADSSAVNVPPFEAPTGKQHAARLADSPLDFLQLFLPPGLVQQWADYTNDYAQQRGAEREWRTTAPELYAFLGVHIYMGICNLPRWHMYWSELYQQPFVASVFPRWRFEQLLRYFHVAPPPTVAAAADPLSRVRPLIQSLQLSFSHYYLPTQSLTIDDALVGFKGRASIKQYIRSKPHKWGFKVWCLANEGYLLAFQVYEGKEAVRSEHGQAHAAVLRLVQPYQRTPHILYMDNEFTSPALLDALLQRGMRGCGTVRRNRRGLPAIPAASIRALQRGQYLFRQQGQLSLVVWSDRRPVWVLSNHASPQETAALQRTKPDGETVAVPCPKAVRDYNFHRSEVDSIDQLHAGYLIGRKSKKSWSRLAWWLLDMCILNAFQLWSIGKDAPRQLDFREELMHSLVKLFGADRKAVQASRGANASVALARDHFLQHAPARGDCAYCSHQPDHRITTSYQCAKCAAHLCIGSCFQKYHAQ